MSHADANRRVTQRNRIAMDWHSIMATSAAPTQTNTSCAHACGTILDFPRSMPIIAPMSTAAQNAQQQRNNRESGWTELPQRSQKNSSNFFTSFNFFHQSN